MKHKIGMFVACLFSLAACNFENYEDCKDEDGLDIDDDWGGHSQAGEGPGEPGGSGAASSGGSGGSAASGSGAAAATAGTTGEPEPSEPEPTPCDSEGDCAPGFNCDYEAGVCAPSDAETCGELTSEQSCTNRIDCTPVYAGTNCSCGADCECMGGEPGCICESFDFFSCAAAE